MTIYYFLFFVSCQKNDQSTKTALDSVSGVPSSDSGKSGGSTGGSTSGTTTGGDGRGTSNMGPSDSGGGDLTASTAEDVKQAIAIAISIIKNDDKNDQLPQEWKTITVWSRLLLLDNLQNDLKIADVLEDVLSPSTRLYRERVNKLHQEFLKSSEPSQLQTENGIKKRDELRIQLDKLLESDPNFFSSADYVDKSKIIFSENSDCTVQDNISKFASVSKHTIGADICFSIEKMKVIPKESLLKQIFALLVHELAHIRGYDEIYAEGAQKYILENFERIATVDGLYYKKSIQNYSFQLSCLLEDEVKRFFNDPFRSILGIGKSLAVSQLLQNLILDDSFPIHPNNISAFSKAKGSLKKLIIGYENIYKFNTDLIKSQKLQLNQLSKEEVQFIKQLMKDIRDHLTLVNIYLLPSLFLNVKGNNLDATLLCL